VSLHDGQSESSYTAAFSQLHNLWLATCPAATISNFMTDDSPFYLKFWVKLTALAKSLIF